MADIPDRHPVPLRARRDETIQVLCTEFAQDGLTLEEFERRLDQAHRAETMADLEVLVADLKPIPAATAQATPASQTLPAHRADVRESDTIVAIMGGVGRKGPWTPARNNHVFAFMGGAELDFREARMPPGVTELTIVCLMGGAEIVVPPGMAVECSGVAIMGGFEDVRVHNPAPEAPVLRINGFVMMGGVEISVREPGESARAARKRLRAQRRGLLGE